jgi:hypothetical protein
MLLEVIPSGIGIHKQRLGHFGVSIAFGLQVDWCAARGSLS